jgi:predicted ATPase
MSSVRSLTITGYKSIRKLENFPLTNLNVLIGANGAGKSNFIGLFRLLNEMVEQRLQLYVQTQGGPDALLHFGRNVTDKLQAKFYFGTDTNEPGKFDTYKFALIPTNDNRLIFESEFAQIAKVSVEQQKSGGLLVGAAALFANINPWLALGGALLAHKITEQHIQNTPLGTGHSESKLKDAADQHAQLVRQSVGNWRVYHFHDTSEKAKVKQKHAANDNIRLKMDASNLAAYLRMLHEKYPGHYQNIVDTIRLVAPFFDNFIHRFAEEYVELEWTQKGKPDTPFKAHMLSDGTLRFICLATLLLQPTELLPETLLIDEPELGLHPYAISILADIFKQVSEQSQLIVSTQSVELVNELSPQDIIVVDQEEGVSTFKRFTDEELSGWLEQYSMGELWKRNVLGGRP